MAAFRNPTMLKRSLLDVNITFRSGSSHLFWIGQAFASSDTLSICPKDKCVPGPDRTSSWWPHLPLCPGRRVVRMFPIRSRNRSRIVLVREGCTNRPFFTIQIRSNLSEAKAQGIEQVGSWDPFPNKDHGEQLIALNLERIAYWLGRGAEPSTRVAELLGLAGFLPVHPRSYLVAHRTRLATETFIRRQYDDQKSEGETNEPDAVAEANESKTDVTKRPDSVWRRGREPPWWWYIGLP
ncbi:small subunit ribosomal protein S16 [Paragonimus westermani]|uniref:Small ribosomal subunit protein bS16m n=1 Tax=Paragonimus westermani TaxID=34504 RepID=A0A5J4NC71_9TREM|nr:small subunit ribosomal protein S16 [Paragonimus westermani]